MGRSVEKHSTRDDSTLVVASNQPDESDSDSRNRSVYLVGMIDEATSAIVVARMAQLAQVSNKPIQLIINTPGGYVYDALAIYDAMKLVRCPIHTVGIGKVMSAGVVILAGGEKGHRSIGARSTIMIHNGYDFFAGDIWEIENELAESKRLDRVYNDCLLKDTKIGKKQLKKILESRIDSYITPKLALKYGIVDRITD